MGLNARRQAWDGRRLGMETLEARRVLAIDFELLNINSTPSSASSSPGQFVAVGANYFFTAWDATHGIELWTTDGTEAGTTFVKDTNPGTFGGQFLSMTAVDGLLFFASDNGKELWRSDGTEGGTIRLLDLTTPIYSPVNSLTEFEGKLFFTVLDNGLTTLWSSDGTVAGTTRVFDTTLSTTFTSIYALTNANGILYFSGDDGFHGVEPWRSDGTEAGTSLLADVAPGTASSLTRTADIFLHSSGRTYFFANDGVHGRELWQTNGTAVGTSLVIDLRPGAEGSITSGTKPEIVSTGDDFYFAASGSNGSQLWRSNGTAATTVAVGAAFGLQTPTWLTNVAGVLMFSGVTPEKGSQLWRSTTTPDGAAQVLEILPGNSGTNVQNLTNVGGVLYFLARNAWSGPFITWTSNGTTAGTVPLESVEFVFADTAPNEVVSIGSMPGETLLSVTIDGKGKELWRAANGSYSLVKDIAAGDAGLAPAHLMVVEDRAYFINQFGENGRELWVTDGTGGGTVKLRDRVRNYSLPNDSLMAAVDGIVYFVAGGILGDELWRTDGTLGGTRQVADIRPGSMGSDPGYLTNVDGTLFFVATGADGTRLRKLDENETPVALTAPLNFFFAEMVEAGGSLYLLADGGVWVSNGTPEGTAQLVDFGGVNDTPRGLTELNGKVYFAAGPTRWQTELWTSDGSVAGTVMLKEIDPGLYGSIPHSLTNVGGTLFFGADDGVHGVELWKSNGTAEGTVMVRDSIPGSSGLSFIETLINVDGTAFYYANNGIRGMWYSDGTESGTGPLASLLPAGARTRSQSFVKIGDKYYFEANDGIHGEEVWSTDLTLAGTALVADLTNDSGGSLPDNFFVLNNKLIVTATSLEWGRELWVATLPPAAGDYDADGRVDGADFLAWQRSFGVTANPTGSGADGDGNGTVGSGDLSVWQANFGVGGSAAAAAIAASEFAIAALVADEEAIDGGEEYSDASVGSAADAAFAWLAGDRATMDRGGWQRSASEAELLARDWAARSARSAVTARSELRDDGGIRMAARKLLGAELAFDACDVRGDSDGEELPATRVDRRGERLAAFFAL